MDSKISERLKKYTSLVKRIIDPKMIILYGSYARGNENELSDIDIAIVVDNIKGNLIDYEYKLYKLRRNVDDRIEPVILNEKRDKSGFLDSILSYGKILYKA